MRRIALILAYLTCVGIYILLRLPDAAPLF